MPLPNVGTTVAVNVSGSPIVAGDADGTTEVAVGIAVTANAVGVAGCRRGPQPPAKVA